MKDFRKQIEDPRKEITEAIIVLLRKHGLDGIGILDFYTIPNAPDS